MRWRNSWLGGTNVVAWLWRAHINWRHGKKVRGWQAPIRSDCWQGQTPLWLRLSRLPAHASAKSASPVWNHDRPNHSTNNLQESTMDGPGWPAYDTRKLGNRAGN